MMSVFRERVALISAILLLVISGVWHLELAHWLQPEVGISDLSLIAAVLWALITCLVVVPWFTLVIFNLLVAPILGIAGLKYRRALIVSIVLFWLST